MKCITCLPEYIISEAAASSPLHRKCDIEDAFLLGGRRFSIISGNS